MQPLKSNKRTQFLSLSKRLEGATNYILSHEQYLDFTCHIEAFNEYVSILLISFDSYQLNSGTSKHMLNTHNISATTSEQGMFNLFYEKCIILCF